jgi:hypothetical protein
VPDRRPPQSFAVVRGESITLNFSLPINIASDIVRFVVRRVDGDKRVLLSNEPGGGAVASAVDDQSFDVLIADEATARLPRGTFRWSAELEDPGGDKAEVAWGYLTAK